MRGAAVTLCIFYQLCRLLAKPAPLPRFPPITGPMGGNGRGDPIPWFQHHGEAPEVTAMGQRQQPATCPSCRQLRRWCGRPAPRPPGGLSAVGRAISLGPAPGAIDTHQQVL
ncbi:hypothetical protein GWK47_014427 [Chionoecetes opilio]|uniref:Secreted protein n=1 Tax=Chionoecetes opilio TaxID=41210 RepID=A0A8J4XUV5_CHIOP|nr:hypothetical protein GWK47_014427 [Chionoecetes opilio]